MTIRRPPCSVAFIVSILLVQAWPGAAQTNWPMFRGAQAQGVVKDVEIPTVWNTETPLFFRTQSHVIAIGAARK